MCTIGIQYRYNWYHTQQQWSGNIVVTDENHVCNDVAPFNARVSNPVIAVAVAVAVVVIFLLFFSRYVCILNVDRGFLSQNWLDGKQMTEAARERERKGYWISKGVKVLENYNLSLINQTRQNLSLESAVGFFICISPNEWEENRKGGRKKNKNARDTNGLDDDSSPSASAASLTCVIVGLDGTRCGVLVTAT